MNNIVNKNNTKQLQTKFKLTDDSFTTDDFVISSKYNDLFENIGPNLAKKSFIKLYQHLIFWEDHLLTQYFYPRLLHWKSKIYSLP